MLKIENWEMHIPSEITYFIGYISGNEQNKELQFLVKSQDEYMQNALAKQRILCPTNEEDDS